MKRGTGLAALAALLLLAGGCEREKAPQVAPAQTPKAEEPKPVAAEEKAALPAIEQKIEQQAAQPAAPAAPSAAGPAGERKPMPPEKKAALPAVDQKTGPAAAPKPPATVTYEASNGAVVFDHQGHAGKLPCVSCHDTDPPAKVAIDKEKAHALCKGCHQEKGSGPVQCSGCHKKR